MAARGPLVKFHSGKYCCPGAHDLQDCHIQDLRVTNAVSKRPFSFSSVSTKKSVADLLESARFAIPEKSASIKLQPSVHRLVSTKAVHVQKEYDSRALLKDLDQAPRYNVPPPPSSLGLEPPPEPNCCARWCGCCKPPPPPPRTGKYIRTQTGGGFIHVGEQTGPTFVRRSKTRGNLATQQSAYYGLPKSTQRMLDAGVMNAPERDRKAYVKQKVDEGEVEPQIRPILPDYFSSRTRETAMKFLGSRELRPVGVQDWEKYRTIGIAGNTLELNSQMAWSKMSTRVSGEQQ